MMRVRAGSLSSIPRAVLRPRFSALPACSENATLERVFKKAPDFLNREYTLPCTWKRKHEHPTVAVDRALQAHVESGLRNIVLPEHHEQLPAELLRSVRVFASPYECGRVLEHPQPFMWNGKPWSLTYKGVGVTDYLRTGREKGATSCVRDFPFFGEFGWMALQKARAENAGSAALQSENLRTEIVAGIYEIESIVGLDGAPLTFWDLFDRGYVHGTLPAVLLPRLMRTNFRLHDFRMLHGKGWGEAIPDLADETLRLWNVHEGREGSFTDYLKWLVQETVVLNVQKGARGYPPGFTPWFTLARNTTLLAEDCDLEGEKIDPQALADASVLEDHLRTHVIKPTNMVWQITKVLELYGVAGISGDELIAAARTGLERSFAGGHPALARSGTTLLNQLADDLPVIPQLPIESI